MGGKGFVEDMREYIAQLNREKRYSSAKSYQEVLDSFIKYSGTVMLRYYTDEETTRKHFFMSFRITL